MEAMPSALVKDLLSTGYFYEELKNYTDSKEIDLLNYSRNYAVPYLIKMANFYKNSGQSDSTAIWLAASTSMKEAADEKLIDSIFWLKKITTSEIDFNERSLHQIRHDDRSALRSCRQKSESARALIKFLVSIIKMFKLAEAVAKGRAPRVLGNEIEQTQEIAVS